eukprot:563752-Pelagomonas_calceolata.AAC.2
MGGALARSWGGGGEQVDMFAWVPYEFNVVQEFRGSSDRAIDSYPFHWKEGQAVLDTGRPAHARPETLDAYGRDYL